METYRINNISGDEMNIFIPQSIQTLMELAEIANVIYQVISPKNSAPIIGATQDVLVGSYLITDPSVHIEWKSVMNILSATSFSDFKNIKKSGSYTGSELVSMLLPPNLKINHAGLEIADGKIVKGRMKANHLGAKSDSLIHSIWDEYGPHVTQSFIDDVSRVINNFILWNGFSVGIQDTELDKDVKLQVDTLYETKKVEVDHLITDMENNPKLLDPEIFEESIKDMLNSVGNDASKLVMDNLPHTNGLWIMIDSETKGSPSNMGQLIGCKGQENVDGTRVKTRLNGRSLPYFYQNDDGAYARGFVKSAFMDGLNPIEFIYLNMAGRVGLIDTAIRTAESGYIQRRLVKALEDLSIKYDGTARNSNNTVIQFVYGDSGVDSCKQYGHQLKIIEYGNKEVMLNFCFTKDELKNVDMNEKENNEYYEELIRMRNEMRDIMMTIAPDNITLTSHVHLPVNLKRLIDRISKEKGNSKLSAKYVLKKIDDILEYDNTKINCLSKKEMANKKSLKYQDELLCKTLFKLALHQFIGPKVMIFGSKFSKEQFDMMCDIIIQDFNKAIVEPGEMVGSIAAQSIGEPVTQMTLNTFHSSGRTSATLLGVPRMREIFSFTRNMKKPVMMISLEKSLREDINYANRLASYMRYTILRDIRDKVDIYYDPVPTGKDSFMEQDRVTNVFYTNKVNKFSCQQNVSNLPWLMRIMINKEAMMDKNIRLIDIKARFCEHWENRFKDSKGMKKEEKSLLEKITFCSILSTAENSETPIIHIRFDMSNFNFTTIVNFLDVFVDNIKLKGLSSINDCTVIPNERVIDFDGEDEGVVNKTQNIIVTDGVNMTDLRYLNGINLNNTVTNNIVEVYELFGIEAARSILIKEVKIAMKSFINFQHISLLCDQMTCAGILISVDRHGMNKLDTEVLSRASFEKTVDQVLQAAVFSEVDHMESVSARIMAGLAIKGGTGMCDVVLDTELIENSEYTEEVKYKKVFAGLSTDVVIDDIISKETDVNDFFMPD